ncbi:hypothetical protein BV133_1824 [Blastochloris viridis]|uniref:Uncharacterized protein n=1 Tax=Blastochloris viridis TaxID=1079 RepID=A0A182D374_BLAVI|nr:hypothetical protein BV133_1824 [Blastochloris viridis]
MLRENRVRGANFGRKIGERVGDFAVPNQDIDEAGATIGQIALDQRIWRWRAGDNRIKKGVGVSA